MFGCYSQNYPQTFEDKRLCIGEEQVIIVPET
jgi:hypothetical protein